MTLTRMVNDGSEPNPFYKMSRRLAECGLATIPLPEGEKKPVLKGWQNKATRDEAVHRAWFDAGLLSAAGIGIATGAKSGVFVLDIDVKDDGPETLAAFEREHGKLPVTPRQNTPTGGWHLPFRLPPGVTIKNSARELGPGLDVRGEGGQIVAEPSTHPKGGQYRWADGLAPWDVPIADAPAWLLDLIQGAEEPPPQSQAATISTDRVSRGARNATIYNEGCRLRGMGLGIEAIEAHCLAFNRDRCDEPLPDDEVLSTARSAAGHKPNVWYELNDTGNAERFVHDHGERVRYDKEAGLWHVWDGSCWRKDERGLAMMRLASETVAGIKDAADGATKAEVKKALKRHARDSGDRARLRAMIDVAASLPGVAVSSHEFDRLPGILVAVNGVIDLATGDLLPHDPARLNTKCLPTAYDPAAEAPQFIAFLERSQPDPDVRTFLQRTLGQALHGTRPEHMMTWWHGRGRNGKSVLADLLLGLLPGYAVEISAAAFVTDDKKDPNRPRSDLMRLRGSRLVLGAEADDRRRLDSQRLKQLTGDATLPVREIQGRETAYAITFHMAVLTNDWPNADETDDALWSRFVRVPFEIVIPPGERVKDLHKKILATEAEGVLALLVRGAIDYHREGLTTPPVLVEATQEWRRRKDTVGRFMRERTRRSEGNALPLTETHSLYIKFVQQMYGTMVGINKFRNRLETLGYTVVDDENGERIQDVQLAPYTILVPPPPVTSGGA